MSEAKCPSGHRKVLSSVKECSVLAAFWLNNEAITACLAKVQKLPKQLVFACAFHIKTPIKETHEK